MSASEDIHLTFIGGKKWREWANMGMGNVANNVARVKLRKLRSRLEIKVRFILSVYLAVTWPTSGLLPMVVANFLKKELLFTLFLLLLTDSSISQPA